MNEYRNNRKIELINQIRDNIGIKTINEFAKQQDIVSYNNFKSVFYSNHISNIGITKLEHLLKLSKELK